MRLLTGRWSALALYLLFKVLRAKEATRSARSWLTSGAKARDLLSFYGTAEGRALIQSKSNRIQSKSRKIASRLWGRSLKRGVAIGFLSCLLLPLAAVGQITVNDSFFSPSTLTITAGQTVTWSWAGSLFHNVHSGTTNGSSCFAGGPLNSGATQNSGTYGPIQFTVAGTYPYFCDPHCTFMTGSITVNPAAANHLSLSAPGSATAGVAFNITVTAFDQFGNVATGFRGTVNFTSSDGTPTLPSSSNLINGSRTFSVTLRTVGSGSQRITASASGVTSSTAFVSMSPAATSTFTLVPSVNPVNSRASFNVAVTAKDAFGNTTPAYGGTVHLTSSDGAATLPGNNTLVSGARTFTGVILRTAGTETVTATDTLSSSITGTSGGITVHPGPAHHFSVSAPPGAFAVLPFNITVTALDQFGNQPTPARPPSSPPQPS